MLVFVSEEIREMNSAVFRIALVLALTGAVTSIRASEMAQATISSTQINSTTWQYDISLDDVGTTDLGTFWFSWVPGEDFMPSSPTDILSPSDWTEIVTHGGPSDGYAIQWVDDGALLTPGNTLTGFEFDSNVSPTTMAGDSPFYTSTPILTSFVYGNGPFSDSGDLFVVTPVSATPEPSTALLAFGCTMGFIALSVLRRRAKA